MFNKSIGLQVLVLVLSLGAGSAVASTWTYGSTGPANMDGLSASAAGISASNALTATISASTAYYGGGLGITSTGESTNPPHHAIDNNGAIESMLITFSDGVAGSSYTEKVNLSSVSFGWVSGDSDFSVYAYTGAGVGNPIGLTYSNLTSNGWTLIGNFNGGNTGSTLTSYNITNSYYSSYWLVGAYNGVSGSLDTSDDYFKLASVTGTACTSSTKPGCGGVTPPTSVPEPGTLLLISGGLLGLHRYSRRRA